MDFLVYAWNKYKKNSFFPCRFCPLQILTRQSICISIMFSIMSQNVAFLDCDHNPCVNRQDIFISNKRRTRRIKIREKPGQSSHPKSPVSSWTPPPPHPNMAHKDFVVLYWLILFPFRQRILNRKQLLVGWWHYQCVTIPPIVRHYFYFHLQQRLMSILSIFFLQRSELSN